MFLLWCMAAHPLQAGEVRIEAGPQGHRLMLDGQPFPLRGAAATGHLEALAAAGANVVRLYGEDQAPLLDEAAKHGLKAIAGIWLEHPRHGFDYADEDALRQREAEVREYVLRTRNHPAVLLWGIGNELEIDHPDPLPAWRFVNRLARMVKELDPGRPVMLTVAEIDEDKLARLAELVPDVDILGVNSYGGGIETLGDRLRAAGWNRPVIVAEFGPLGQWQAEYTAWGVPYEPDSTIKAELYGRWFETIEADPALMGGIAFLWGAKQEQTSTWHGMFLESGEALEAVDVLTHAWTGKWPEHRAPRIEGKWISGQVFPPGSLQQANALAEGESLSWDWQVVPESTDLRQGGDLEAAPVPVPGSIVEVRENHVTFRVPDKPGPYRLFLTLRDGKGKAATANMPFLVEE